ncbi:MAG: hypothetical protein U5K36_03040 [Roseovarius sp.]|nr:hypothetical protein [Roseovarius sp.]
MTIRVSLAQSDVTALDAAANRARIVEIAGAAHEREEMLCAELEMGEGARYRGLVGLFNDRRPELYGVICEPGRLG